MKLALLHEAVQSRSNACTVSYWLLIWEEELKLGAGWAGAERVRTIARLQ
jgi:hypothetical protein